MLNMHCVICVGEGAGTKEELNGLKNSSATIESTLSEIGISSSIYIIKQNCPINIPRCDFVFNLCDNDEGYIDSFINFTTFLERKGIPYTGNTSTCFRACQDKLSWSKNSVMKTYFPVRSNNLQGISIPCIIKHRYNHGSLFPMHVINDKKDSLHYNSVTEDYFYEEFITGKELSISCLLNETPLIGIRCFDDGDVLDFQTKWQVGVGVERYTLSNDDFRYITQMVHDIRTYLNVNSYMRLDLRMSKNNNLYLIDINPNCSLDPQGSFCTILAQYNINYKLTIESIVFKLLNES